MDRFHNRLTPYFFLFKLTSSLYENTMILMEYISRQTTYMERTGLSSVIKLFSEALCATRSKNNTERRF